MELIDQISISDDSSIRFNRIGTYTGHVLLYRIVPSTNLASIYLQFSTDNGTTWDNGSVYPNAYVRGYSLGPIAGADPPTSLTLVAYQPSNESHSGVGGRLYMFDLPDAALYKPFRKDIVILNEDDYIYWEVHSGIYQRTSPVTAIKIMPNSGLLASGFAALYGLKPGEVAEAGADWWPFFLRYLNNFPRVIV